MISAPDAGRLDAALPLLDAMISIDNYLNETTRHAHVILPGLSPLEQPHCDEAIWGFALRAVARWSPPISTPATALTRGILRLGASSAACPADSVDVATLDDEMWLARAARRGVDGTQVESWKLKGPDRYVDLTFRTSTHGDRYGENPGGLTLEEVKRHPHGLDLGTAYTELDDILRTASGDIELAHDDILGDLDRLARRMAEPYPGLVLIGRRHVRSNNSWLHNLPRS